MTTTPHASPGPDEVVHLRGLNGLRAMAALLVVAYHVTEALPSFGLSVRRIPNIGAYGVTIFFSLSGFLITFLLLREKALIRSVRLSSFYVRRVLRIWPLYFLYLALCLGWTQGEGSEGIVYYVLLAPNIPFVFGGAIKLAAHYWSLGVEEQFYAFWPVLIKHAGGVRGAILRFLAAFVVIKLAVMAFYGGYSKQYQLLYDTRFDCMAIGGLGACQFFSDPAGCKVVTKKLIDAGSWLLLTVVLIGALPFSSFLIHDLVAVITVIIILNQVINASPLVALERAPLDFVGKISFGIYVYHPLVIAIHTLWIKGLRLPPEWKYLFVYLVVTLTTLVVAYVSYHFFERHFLALKARHATVRSQSDLSS